MKFLLGKYTNGNYTVQIYDDGTKVRSTEDDEFVAEFPECVDINISNYCDQNCKYCYANSSKKGTAVDLSSPDVIQLIDSLHPYTEIAINGNIPTDPQLVPFLQHCKAKNIIVNMTVNQKHFISDYEVLKKFVDEGLIKGLGVSLIKSTSKFIKLAKTIKNLVIHTIVGITTQKDYEALYDKDFKVLVLGYKTIGRGIKYKDKFAIELDTNNSWINQNLGEVSKHFAVLSFDNLAIKQLDIKARIGEKLFNERFMGFDGTHSFYINLPEKKFAISSTHSEEFVHDIVSYNVDDMFNVIKEEVKNLDSSWKI